MLLLRAFYSKFGNMKDPYAIKTSEDISTCIWKTNEFGQPDKNRLKLIQRYQLMMTRKNF